MIVVMVVKVLSGCEGSSGAFVDMREKVFTSEGVFLKAMENQGYKRVTFGYECHDVFCKPELNGGGDYYIVSKQGSVWEG